MCIRDRTHWSTNERFYSPECLWCKNNSCYSFGNSLNFKHWKRKYSTLIWTMFLSISWAVYTKSITILFWIAHDNMIEFFEYFLLWIRFRVELNHIISSSHFTKSSYYRVHHGIILPLGPISSYGFNTISEKVQKRNLFSHIEKT